MNYLVLKDLLLQKRMLILGFVYAFFFHFTFQGMGDKKIVSIIAMIGYLFVMMGAGWEEKNSSDKLWNSLPVPKWKIVGAKYLSPLVYAAIAIPMCWIANLIFYLVSPEYSTAITVPYVIIGILVVMFLSSLFFPVYFALGYTKARYMHFALFFGVFFLANMIPRLVPDKPGWVDPLLAKLPALNTGVGIGIVFTGFVAVIAGISFMISLYLYSRREF